jgi:hypothetical protein
MTQEAITPDPGQVRDMENLIANAAGGGRSGDPAIQRTEPVFEITPLPDGGGNSHRWEHSASVDHPSASGTTELAATTSGERHFPSGNWQKLESQLTITDRITNPDGSDEPGKVLQSKIRVIGTPDGDKIRLATPMETRTKNGEVVKPESPMSERRLRALDRLIRTHLDI